MSDIVKLIEALVEQKTLSLDAIKAVQTVRERAVALETTLSQMTQQRDTMRESLNNVTREYDKYVNREAELVAREKKMAELEIKVAVAEAKTACLDSMFSRMFANRILRENVQHDVWVSQGSGGNTYASKMQNADNITREEG